MLGGALDEARAHTIAVGKAVGEHNGDVFGVNAGEDQSLLHHGASGDTIGIVVAVDEDFFLVFDGLVDTSDGLLHPGEDEGIGEILVFWL